MDPNLQQLLWAAYPLACFWFGGICASDIKDEHGFMGGLLIVVAILGHLVGGGFIVYATLRAFNIVQ